MSPEGVGLKENLRLLLVDDHQVVRMGLRFVLEDLPNVQLVGEASSADEAMDQCQLLEPDVVIMDIKMPGKNGIEACRQIVSRWPQIQVIMLTSFVDDNLVFEAIQAGAAGYVMKGVSTDELLRALDAVREGAGLLDPAITRRVLNLMRQQRPKGNPFAELTKRELIVLARIAQGKTNLEIAEELVLSEKTIRNNVSIVLSKLDASNRIEAAMFAIENHIQEYVSD
ncbi:MAG: response regulator transcription factor [Chloroflexi bacterium]|nr:response regulator transcription factor [Chloroflexota bacterium]MBP7044198.1 response regulator transcription factor [Chloroflexota bacterium]